MGVAFSVQLMDCNLYLRLYIMDERLDLLEHQQQETERLTMESFELTKKLMAAEHALAQLQPLLNHNGED